LFTKNNITQFSGLFTSLRFVPLGGDRDHQLGNYKVMRGLQIYPLHSGVLLPLAVCSQHNPVSCFRLFLTLKTPKTLIIKYTSLIRKHTNIHADITSHHNVNPLFITSPATCSSIPVYNIISHPCN